MTPRILQLPELSGSHGRFGNLLLWYALAKHFCETYDATLETPSWDGDRIFDINDPPISGESNVRISWPMAPEMKPWAGIAILNTFQYSFPPLYTDEQFRRWMPFRPEFSQPSNKFEAVAHIRKGDFIRKPSLWPVVTDEQVREAAKAHGVDNLEIISEENPHVNCGHPHKLSWLEDFLIMATAPVLFVYPASTFSACAGKFNRGKVFIPMDYTNGPTKCKWVLREDMPNVPAPSSPITLQ
jgi:hypothetical protein